MAYLNGALILGLAYLAIRDQSPRQLGRDLWALSRKGWTKAKVMYDLRKKAK